MIRRLVMIFAAVSVTGCFDFDSAYAKYCDGGRCAGGTGGGTAGGAATGGGGGGGGDVGGGGGSTGGGGGSTGGGGGGAVGGGGGGAVGGGGGGAADAGCQSFLCPELDYTSPQSTEFFSYFTVAPGINAQSLSRFNIYASFQRNNTVSHIEYRFTNNVPTTIFRTNFSAGRSGRSLSGVSLTDQWFGSGAAWHVVGTSSPQAFDECSLADGGTYDPTHRSVFPVSADEAWAVGYPMSVCHWTSDGGFVQTADYERWPSVYLLAAYQAPSGAIYVVGGDYATGDGVCFISNELGEPYSHPSIVDDYYTDGCSDIGGVGNAIYVLARDDSAGHGQVLALQPDGGFASVYTAPFRLSQFDVLPTGEIWAVGDSSSTAIYFDGGAWAEVPLPLTENRFNVFWENVAGTSDGIILSGNELQPDGGYTAVVNSYRRFGQ